MTAPARKGEPSEGRQRVIVFAPAPLLTITIELRAEKPDVHLHAGGQGFWQARMIRSLGLDVTLCGSFGPEVGAVVRGLIEREDVGVRSVSMSGDNPAYVHDRREGERESIAETPWPSLSRHEIDELYTLTIAEAMEADACLLGGAAERHVLPDDVYRRLAADLKRAGKLVVADLAGGQLQAAVAGGASVVKVSHEALLQDGMVTNNERRHVLGVMRQLQTMGADRVLVSRSDEPALALSDIVLEVVPPHFEPVDVRGAGDSMTAALTASLVCGDDWEHALRIAAAAAALNITRRGLATGTREEVERMAAHVTVTKLDAHDAESVEQTVSTTPDELAQRAKPA